MRLAIRAGKWRSLSNAREPELKRPIHMEIQDFGKSKHHTQLTELFPLFEELESAVKNLAKWAKPRRVRTNLLNQPGKSLLLPEPLGVTLVISAWNFPYNLSLVPVVGSMMAGNTTVLKPSELAAESSRVMANTTASSVLNASPT
ncbi:MAG: aldehyde dehydrogenase family protein [Planctomycetota bacterium]